ncbi:MAG: hypothetical protein LBT13_11440 [Treponema sp.]|jgi:hypothetical protein|nr:hypothetical protein [Treponema sp.]
MAEEEKKDLMALAVKKTGLPAEKIQQAVDFTVNFASKSQENFGQVLNSYNKTLDFMTEGEKTKREIAKYESAERVAIAGIQEKYGLLRSVFGELFAERRAAMSKDFEVIDKGLRENDYNLINMGLASLSKVVTASPFADLVSFQKALESDDETIEL